MKRNYLILTIIVCFFAFQGGAKTTYIPTYDNRLILIENGEVDSLKNQKHSLSMASKDGPFRPFMGVALGFVENVLLYFVN